jgi:predicted DNA-binding transcriptional regulator AlpA
MSTKPVSQGIPAALRNFDSLPDSAHVRLPVVCGWTGLAPATVYRRIAEGKLPQPKHIGGGRASSWLVGELRRSTDRA